MSPWWLLRLGALCAVAALGPPASDAIADPGAFQLYLMNGDFSIASNPNGVWSYLANGSLITHAEARCFQFKHPGDECWTTELPIPNSITVSHNKTGHSFQISTVSLPPHYLQFDPESGSVTVRFTAPTSGNASIRGDFLGLDEYENAHTVQILLNGQTVLFSREISSFGQKRHFYFSVALAQGDHVDFTTMVGKSYTNLSTGVRARIVMQ